jgi:hypothetical protein
VVVVLLLLLTWTWLKWWPLVGCAASLQASAASEVERITKG